MVGLNGRWDSYSSSCASGIVAVGIDCVCRWDAKFGQLHRLCWQGREGFVARCGWHNTRVICVKREYCRMFSEPRYRRLSSSGRQRSGKPPVREVSVEATHVGSARSADKSAYRSQTTYRMGRLLFTRCGRSACFLPASSFARTPAKW
jgi:hypothetical protein